MFTENRVRMVNLSISFFSPSPKITFLCVRWFLLSNLSIHDIECVWPGVRYEWRWFSLTSTVILNVTQANYFVDCVWWRQRIGSEKKKSLFSDTTNYFFIFIGEHLGFLVSLPFSLTLTFLSESSSPPQRVDTEKLVWKSSLERARQGRERESGREHVVGKFWELNTSTRKIQWKTWKHQKKKLRHWRHENSVFTCERQREREKTFPSYAHSCCCFYSWNQ